MTEKNDNIKCVVRIRPGGMNEIEKKINEICATANEDHNTVSIDSNDSVKPFKFDWVFDANSTQESVFNEVGIPTIEALFEGYNATIFAYGQTGSGKTHTMMGPYSALFNNNDNEKTGLIPRILFKIFDMARELKNGNVNNMAIIKCSCSEIYQEQIKDLLNNSENLTIYEDAKKGTFVDGLTEQEVDNDKYALELILIGLKNRHVAATKMNLESSRSHLIFSIFLSTSVNENGLISNKQSRLHLVDLAGSERQKSTEAKGDRIKEAGMINKSLTTLGTVINALVEEKTKFVPFRDSKLTFFLKDSLGGNSKTTIIANISPCLVNIQETISTLKFVQRAKLIKNKANINENVSGSLKTLQDEITRLREELEKRKEKQNFCEKCNRKQSLLNTISDNFQNVQETVKNSIRKTIINAQDLLNLQERMAVEKKVNDMNNEDLRESTEIIVPKIYTKDEIKEFIMKIDGLINFELDINGINGKLCNFEKFLQVIDQFTEERKKYEKQHAIMIEEFQKKQMKFDLIYKLKENILTEISTDNVVLSQNIEKLVNEEIKFRTEIENQTEFWKLIEENINLKSELDSIKISKEVINKQGVEVLVSIINEFVDTNNMLQTYIRDNIEHYIKDNNVDCLLLEINEMKSNFYSLEKQNIQLKHEIYDINDKKEKEQKSLRNIGVDMEIRLKEINDSLDVKNEVLEEKNCYIDQKNKELEEIRERLGNLENDIIKKDSLINQNKMDIEMLVEGNNLYLKDMIQKNEENVGLKELLRNLNEFFRIKEIIVSEFADKDLSVIKLKMINLDDISNYISSEVIQNCKLEFKLFVNIIQELNNTLNEINNNYLKKEYEIKLEEEKANEIRSLIMEDNSISISFFESVKTFSQNKLDISEKMKNLLIYFEKLEENVKFNEDILNEVKSVQQKEKRKININHSMESNRNKVKKSIEKVSTNALKIICKKDSKRDINTNVNESETLSDNSSDKIKNEKRIKELENELKIVNKNQITLFEENKNLKAKFSDIINNYNRTYFPSEKDKKEAFGVLYNIKILNEEKKRLENEIFLLSSDFYKNLSQASINQKLSVLMQIKAENYKLKIELNGLKKRNECLEVDVQQMQNNTKNENQKFTSLPSTYNLTSEEEDIKSIKKENDDLIDRILSLNVKTSSNYKSISRYDKAIECLNSFVQIIDLHQFYKDFQQNNKNNVKQVTNIVESQGSHKKTDKIFKNKNTLTNTRLTNINSQPNILSEELKKKKNQLNEYTSKSKI